MHSGFQCWCGRAGQCSQPSKPTVAALLAVSLIVGACRGRAEPPAQVEKEPLAMSGTTPKTSERPQPRNALANATSPYLLQHADNPVNWQEWSPEALQQARRENKPIFLSIGYSACHWCHVMEHESFENEEIAAILNQYFVPIKVDREERPDIDEIYMQATIAMTGHGGWPMSVFLTPDLKPFFCGTYFRPEQFKMLLLRIAEVWEQQPEQVREQSERVAAYLREWASGPPPGEDTIPPGLVVQTAERLEAAFDHVLGGIVSGSTNKFPPSMAMDLLLRAWRRTGEARYLRAVEVTLDRMAAGGIYDHIGGGFHRYSTDVRWLVPHFEKMLYDQALVASIYLDAYQATAKPAYARVARETFDYVLREMQSPEGGFYSTQDADSEGYEGKYYIWTVEQVEEVLGKEDARWFCRYYDITAKGNWEDPYGHAPPGPKNILNTPRPLKQVAEEFGMSAEEFERRLADARRRLLEARSRRTPPGLDDKVLASWNGLMIASLAKGSAVLNEPRYAEAAARAADFVLTRMRNNGRLLHAYRAGTAHLTGYLDDYAFMIEGLLGLYETTFEPRWLEEAERLNEVVLTHFADSEHGGFFYTADDHEELLVRSKDLRDGATPSGNSVEAMNLLRLAILLDRRDLREQADRLFRAVRLMVERSPGAFERLLCAVDFRHDAVKEIAVVGPRSDPRTQALLRTVWSRYLPNKVVALLEPGAPQAEAVARRIPLLKGKTLVDSAPAAYVCQNYTCQAPVTTPAALASSLWP